MDMLQVCPFIYIENCEHQAYSRFCRKMWKSDLIMQLRPQLDSWAINLKTLPAQDNRNCGPHYVGNNARARNPWSRYADCPRGFLITELPHTFIMDYILVNFSFFFRTAYTFLLQFIDMNVHVVWILPVIQGLGENGKYRKKTMGASQLSVAGHRGESHYSLAVGVGQQGRIKVKEKWFRLFRYTGYLS